MKVINFKFLSVLLAFLTLNAVVSAQTTFYAVSNQDDSLRLIDVSTTTVFSTIPITLAGEVVIGVNGLAEDPNLGTVYAILKLNSTPTRVLVTLDLATGVAILIGDTGDNFAAITFNNAGILYGVTGDGGNVSEALYTINPFTAATTSVMALGNGTDGETIAVNSDNNLLYHASGNGDVIFESVNIPTSVNDIVLSGDLYSEATAMIYNGGGEFILASWSTFYSVSLGGIVTALDSIGFDFSCKGLVRGTAPVGIAEGTVFDELQLYPNPAGDIVHFKSEQLIGETYKLYNMLGNVIQSGTVTSDLDISNLSSGTYIFNFDARPEIELKLVKQ